MKGMAIALVFGLTYRFPGLRLTPAITNPDSSTKTVSAMLPITSGSGGK
jgi:hypothetical protein